MRFTNKEEDYIKQTLSLMYGPDKADDIYNKSYILKYLNMKSHAIHGNSKSRRSYGAWYSIYVLAKMYIENGYFNKPDEYRKFEGFEYTKVFYRMRGLYGGQKLQNHALNSRTNLEFRNKVTKDESSELIINNQGSYFLNPKYIYVDGVDLTKAIVNITEKYISLLKIKDQQLSEMLEQLENETDVEEKRQKIRNLISEDAEARIFEIISYAILYTKYQHCNVYFGWTEDSVKKHALDLYKTGRTNANDGGIDFVMKPVGRFFQVTEVDNYEKYLLDINKVLHFPITFVIKTLLTHEEIISEFTEFIRDKFGGVEVVEKRYLDSIEDIITINDLREYLDDLNIDDLNQVISNIKKYYEYEFEIN
ncbi:restriction endonuclease [Apilactobacillus kunkeei]|uniref:hypothetical protein n=1 Tax=Apilactobacillus kunkeei TaxID=148814 RepID=UPI00059B3CDA|nr:hypothetical protein [Apilactobacillus kunkeei]KIM18471.1 restriction endonuclease [Apilactobacillus kunkeei]MCK8636101.1 restriction endonuclease [Apilactobacillus kunkeei]